MLVGDCCGCLNGGEVVGTDQDARKGKKGNEIRKEGKGIKKGSVVYFDPPYAPVSKTSNFTGYNESGFGEEEQKRLKRLCDRLTDKKVNILLSNSDCEFIRELYGDSEKYQIISVKAKRAINSNGNSRGEIGEVLIKNNV